MGMWKLPVSVMAQSWISLVNRRALRHSAPSGKKEGKHIKGHHGIMLLTPNSSKMPDPFYFFSIHRSKRFIFK